MGKILDTILSEAKEMEIPKMESSDVVNSETFNLQLDMLFAAYCEIVERSAFSESDNQYFVLVYKRKYDGRVSKSESEEEYEMQRFSIDKNHSFNNFVALIRDYANLESYRLVLVQSSLYGNNIAPYGEFTENEKKYLDDIYDKVTWNKSFFERLIGKKKE